MNHEIREYVPLAPLTTLGVGGPARYFLEVFSDDDLLNGLEFANSRSLDVFVMGGGSNLLVADRGIDALVLRIGIKGRTFEEEDESAIVKVGAGEIWDDLVKDCVERGLGGFECLSGIPGYVGGTPVQNVGAYGQEVSDTIVSVRCYDRKDRTFVVLSGEQCQFSYRSSIFNSSDRNRYIVLGVQYRLKHDAEPLIIYRDLAERFSGMRPTLGEVRKSVLEIRRSKSMVIDPADPNSRSAGSFFKNPVLDREAFEKLGSTLGEVVPSFPFGSKIKVPAAWLIERSGFNKGFSLGNAGLSTRHTLALINRGAASAEDIVALMELIRAKVEACFGIRLVQEPVFAGFDGDKNMAVPNPVDV